MMDVLCLDDASYVLGALTPAEERVFQRHLLHCSRCQVSIAKLARVPWLLLLNDLASFVYPEPS